ncbi:MAG: DNA polymerase III subunit alpha [Bryobacterales bacterium]|nr:DNA polymerase III subunit alpha [Bryobacterales bacterium]MBV9399738.1 DNA polymerase III subunit alpha [Bryobacterales bacterium]
MSAPFVHLHCHTDYSLLDGACEISQLMDLAAEQKMPAIAMTDHGNLFGAVEFYNGAKARGIHPVIGCEVYVAQQGHTVKSDTNRYNHLVLLCENQEGYRNLIQLVTTGFLDGFYYKPRIDKDLLARHSKGLIALSACLRGDINETLLANRYDEAKRLAYQYSDMFGSKNFFLEVQDHGLEPDSRVLPMLGRLSAETGIPLVATNDAHYLRKADARAHEILLCVQTGKKLSDTDRMRFEQPAFYLKSRDEMMAIFGEIEEALDRTWDIAQRCRLKLDPVNEPFPKFPIPEGHTLDTFFEYAAREGFEKRRPRLEAMAAQRQLKHALPEYSERLDREIKMIQQMNFSGYFLIVWDFIRFAKQRGIPVGPGRGSATGSLVSWAMEITDIDPLQYGLIFERFLNPERVSMPDIDIDFCTRGRGEVIQYVTEKYGREQVAQIITFGTLGARTALKDVGRVLDMTFADMDKITKLIPNMPLNIKLAEARKMEPQIDDLAAKEPRIKEVLEVANRLEGVARNAGMHAAGVVIAPVPLKELVPLYKTNKDEIVTQYDMVGLEKLGLLKMDFLGLTTLTIIDDTLELIERGGREKLRIEDLPLDDPQTYQSVFCKGLTSGIFQFESAGMRDILRRYQPDRLDDLIALNALYRPGPMDMIDDFIDRKHGRKEVTYDFPELKDILEESFGVIVYQEQVMQISSRLAGYSLGDADLLRRAMGKKKVEEMAKQRERFIEGAKARGHQQRKVEKIFDQMAKFAGYGFNKSHSAAYAYLAFVIAYLKTHYPLEFMSALLTSETGNTAKVVKYTNECREMNIRVLAPDVNSSDFNFTPVYGGADSGIRFGLGAIKNVGPNAVESIVMARASGGPFTSLYDFCERVDLGAVNRRLIESFIKAGAMDGLGGTRSQQFAALDNAMENGARAWRDRANGQSGLFAALAAEMPATDHPLPKVPDWTGHEKIAGEKEMLGFYITGHPLDQYMDKVRELATHQTSALEGLAKNTEVALCGILTGIQRRRNKEGKLWAALQVEDLEGAIEAMVFSTQYERLLSSLVEDKAILVRGLVLPEENAPPKVSIQDIVPLENARVNLPSLISIRVPLNGAPETGRATALHDLFERKPGSTEVRLRLEKSRDFSVILDLSAKVRPDKEFCAELARICGKEALEILAQ